MTEDERYKALEKEKAQALNEANTTYTNMLNENAQITNSVNDYLNQYQTTQNDIYDKQLAREQEKADLAKKQAEEEYQKEAIASKNAYYDYVNPRGVQAELQAQQGLWNSGYSEGTKSYAWAVQQNRTAQAKATMNKAKLQFDEDMKDARLNNDVMKAQLALQTLQMKQDETLRAFNYRSDVAQNQLANKQNLSSEYNNRYNTIWNQINAEKEQKEAIRQFNEKMAYQKERDKVADSQWEREYALSKQKANNSGITSYGGLTDDTSLEDNSNITLEGGMSVNPYATTNNQSVSTNNKTTSNNNLTQKASLNPNSLSKGGAEFYKKNIQNKNMAYSDVKRLLVNAVKQRIITEDDLAKISMIYS